MSARRWFTITAMIAAALSLALLAACGDDGGDGATPTQPGAEATATEPAADTTPAEGAIDVSLQEFQVTASPASATAGTVPFSITNEGAEPHEFVVIDTDLDPGDLPVQDDGSVDESQVDVIDEVEEGDLQPGDSAELSLDLEAGSYALICNLVEEDHGAHYTNGMFTAFEVTE